MMKPQHRNFKHNFNFMRFLVDQNLDLSKMIKDEQKSDRASEESEEMDKAEIELEMADHVEGEEPAAEVERPVTFGAQPEQLPKPRKSMIKQHAQMRGYQMMNDIDISYNFHVI